MQDLLIERLFSKSKEIKQKLIHNCRLFRRAAAGRGAVCNSAENVIKSLKLGSDFHQGTKDKCLLSSHSVHPFAYSLHLEAVTPTTRNI